MRQIIIAIDGVSSSGKSTLAKQLAAKLGYIFIDTGAMYRAVTLYAMENGAIRGGVVNRKKLVAMLDEISIEFRFNQARGASDIYVNGRLVESEIRGVEVTKHVSEVSSVSEVREKLVLLQQQMGAGRGVVMDGRDIGTVVFPDAEFKLYLTADPNVRAERRYKELVDRGHNVTLEEISEAIKQRDIADMNREISPLRRAEDALELNNSYMSFEQQMEWVEDRLAAIVGDES